MATYTHISTERTIKPDRTFKNYTEWFAYIHEQIQESFKKKIS
jgi:hypothetical protein